MIRFYYIKVDRSVEAFCNAREWLLEMTSDLDKLYQQLIVRKCLIRLYENSYLTTREFKFIANDQLSKWDVCWWFQFMPLDDITGIDLRRIEKRIVN